MAGPPSVCDYSARGFHARTLAVLAAPSRPRLTPALRQVLWPAPGDVAPEFDGAAPTAPALRERRQSRGRHPVEQEVRRIAREETGGGASEEVADGIEGPARSARAGRGLPRGRAGRGSRMTQRRLDAGHLPGEPDERSPAGEHSMANAAVPRAGRRIEHVRRAPAEKATDRAAEHLEER